MTRIRAVCLVAALAAMCVSWAGAQQVVPADANVGVRPQAAVGQDGRGVEVLTDTQGVDFQPYLQGILKQIRDQWDSLMPKDARAPLNKQGMTNIRFTINPDGTIAAMHMDGSAHDAALDRAAWGAITGVGRFPALPSGFHGPNLELRIHFKVNA